MSDKGHEQGLRRTTSGAAREEPATAALEARVAELEAHKPKPGKKSAGLPE